MRIKDGNARLRLLRGHDHAGRPPSREASRDSETIGVHIDMVVRAQRLRSGRSTSFESDLSFAGADVHAVFIRAPLRSGIGGIRRSKFWPPRPPGDRIVAVRQGPLLATSFHPRADTGTLACTTYFVNMVREL
ncbi:hypothetical protein [Nonomuraea dietziae]|uniref:hypothetical protein n=1 Tax=Nonomuraea dietziae TaxID=65515 RepID=UPI0031D0B85E